MSSIDGQTQHSKTSFERKPVKRSMDKESQRYKGVRLRSWGKWVSEIRLPNSRSRIWLGSFPTADMAARAYDAALMCLRGPSAVFNFPHTLPNLPCGPHLSSKFIRQAAAAAARGEIGTHSPEIICSTDEISSSLDEGTSNSSSSECSGHGGELECEGRSEIDSQNFQEETEKFSAAIDKFLAFPPSLHETGEFAGHLASMPSLSNSMSDLMQDSLLSMPLPGHDDYVSYDDFAPFCDLLLWN